MGNTQQQFTLEEFTEFNEVELNCIFAETGRTLELDFDREVEVEELYEASDTLRMQYNLRWEPMSVVEYIRTKNSILKEYAGLYFDLVPEDQIKECERHKLSIKSSATSCPYCIVYLDGNCKSCPMALADNTCETDPSNTWDSYIDNNTSYVEPKAPTHAPLKALIEQFNTSNGFTD